MKHPVIKDAAKFAAFAHRGVRQVRKYTGEPYIVHPAEVAQTVSTISDDPEIIAAAWLHDVVEDTEGFITEQVIKVRFGTRIARLVAGMTDVSTREDGNRAARKAKDRQHLADECGDVHDIKVSDLMSNTHSIVLHDKNFARVYLHEKEQLLQVLTKGDKGLLLRASTQLDAARKHLATL